MTYVRHQKRPALPQRHLPCIVYIMLIDGTYVGGGGYLPAGVNSNTGAFGDGVPLSRTVFGWEVNEGSDPILRILHLDVG